MKIFPYKTLQEIAEFLNVDFIGDPEHPITGINEIHRVESGDIVFVDHPKYYEKALKSAATTIIINKAVECPPGKGLLVSNDPFSDYNKVVEHFKTPLSSLQQVSDSATIGKDTRIFPGVFLADNVKIGNNCIIFPNVSIYTDCEIGNNVIIHANTVIGADAFYYKKRPEHQYEKMLTCGRVIIEDNVEIGALCTIDKGVSADTIIGRGSKLDNQVHVGHDTIIGKNCLIAAQVGIAGVVTIEDNVTIWGQAGIASDLVIGKGAVILAQSGLGKTVEGGKSYFGSPAGEAKEKMREMNYIKRIPEILEKIKQ